MRRRPLQVLMDIAALMIVFAGGCSLVLTGTEYFRFLAPIAIIAAAAWILLSRRGNVGGNGGDDGEGR